jgi:hypothetical protein
MLDLNNSFVKKFRMAKDRLTDHGNEEFIITMFSMLIPSLHHMENNVMNCLHQSKF